MASYGKRGFNTYNEVQEYQDDWGKPITTISDYPDHVCRPVIVDVQGNKSPIVSYSTEHGVEGYVVRTQRIVEVRRSYDFPLNGLLDKYNGHEEWDDDSPRKVNDFLNKVHHEAIRPTHATLLSPPKSITKRPSWRSEDHDSPKYREQHSDFSGSPLRNKFEGLHLQDNRGSSPHSGSPKVGHVKDHGVNNPRDSPPRSRSTHGDWDSRRGHDDYVKSPYSNNKDDYGKPKFNGGYTTSPPTYAPQSHFPATYSTPYIKESYPERIQDGKPLASPVSTQPSYYPTPNPITERKESYPEQSEGVKPLFFPVYTKQPHSTSNPTPQRKESYPEPAYGSKPLFPPVHTQQSHSPTTNPIPPRKESNPETTHGAKPLFSSVYSQQPHSPTTNPIPQRKESYPETTQGPKPLFSPVHSQQPHSPTSNPTPQRKESYPETANSIKPVFSPVYTPQSHSPTSNPTSQRKESYPETAHETNPMFSPVSTQPSHFSTANPTYQNNESNPKKTKGWKSLFSPAAKQQPHPPTSHSTPEMKQSYPDHETQGWKPSFSSSSPQKERYSPQKEDNYPNQIQHGVPFPVPYENAQEPRYVAIVPPKETIDSSEARKRYAHLKPLTPAQRNYSGTIDSREAVERYKGAFVQ